MGQLSVISVLFLSLTMSLSAMASTYECKDDSVKVTYEVDVEAGKFDGVDVVTYQMKTFKQNGDLMSKSSGLGSLNEDYESGQVTKKEFRLGTGASLLFITKNSEIKLRKAVLVGSGANFYNCTLKN